MSKMVLVHLSQSNCRSSRRAAYLVAQSIKTRDSSSITPLNVSTTLSLHRRVRAAVLTAPSSTVEGNIIRSKAEIAGLVRKRVAERNAWKVNGVVASDIPQPSLLDRWKFLKTMPKLLWHQASSQAELDENYPVLPINWNKLQNPPTGMIQVTWLGHSTLLVQMNSVNILTDPIWSERCSPSTWFGPQRFQPPPCSLDLILQTIPIDLAVISHNHYDHLDYSSVLKLSQQKTLVKFVVPLGLRAWFRSYVSTTVPIFEQDWHETIEFRRPTDMDGTAAPRGGGGASLLNVTCVPMRHWTMRTTDRDQTLWCGYSITDLTTGRKFLFPGDTAWFDGLADLALQHGPWDVAAIPIGAYEPRSFMKFHHINVPEAVRMKDAIQAQAAIPIHWGTYPLTSEPVLEPPTKLLEAMKGRPDADTFVPWQIGETRQF